MIKTFYHGTSASNAKKIFIEGFKINQKTNWDVKSKEGFVYFSTAYAPFFAMANQEDERLALIEVEIDEKDLYPEDDYLMGALGMAVYTQEQLAKVNFERYKDIWPKSLKYMGNVAAKPDKIKIKGITFFDRKKLVMKCDPVISPINFMIMGSYYEELSDWIFEGKPIMEFKNFMGPS